MKFSEAAGGGVVFDPGWQVKSLLEDGFEGNVIPPREIWRGLDDAANGVQRAANACAECDDPGVALHERACVVAQVLDHGFGAAAGLGRPLPAVDDLAVAAADAGGAFCAADVQTEKQVAIEGHLFGGEFNPPRLRTHWERRRTRAIRKNRPEDRPAQFRN